MGWFSCAQAAERTIRIATYNASLYGESQGEVQTRLGDSSDRQACKIAAIVQTVRPDILLINEIDYDLGGVTANRLAKNYFAVGQEGLEPIDYLSIYAVPSNTGISSGMDLNRNGELGDPEDAFGFGVYPGQYSMAIYSRFPIEVDKIRTFQLYRWSDLPDALKPVHPETGKPYYSDRAWERLRLSSKNHVDVPIRIGDRQLHLLASHPTPPVFDGEEDHNGCRNHDEIRFWTVYLNDGSAEFLTDDNGIPGGLPTDARFVIAGDLNSDPDSGDSRQQAIRSLLSHPRVRDPLPRSLGALRASGENPAASSALHTAQFGEDRTMRIDYVLPSRNLTLRASGVFWPAEPNRWIDASDHRLVWIEVEIAE